MARRAATLMRLTALNLFSDDGGDGGVEIGRLHGVTDLLFVMQPLRALRDDLPFAMMVTEEFPTPFPGHRSASVSF